MQPDEHHPQLAGLSAQERRILGSLVARELVVITAEDVQATQPMSGKAANLFLSRLHRKGWIRRVKRGLYCPIPLESRTTEPAVESAWPLAMELFAPCYISGWTAAEHWDLTEQIFNTIAVVSSQPQRSSSQVLAGIPFRIRAVDEDRMFGIQRIWVASHAVGMADPHRLIIDILDDPAFGGGGRHVVDVVSAYWKSEFLEPKKLLEYGTRFGSGAVLKRLGFLAELAGVADSKWLDEVEANLTKGVARLDPASGDHGKVNSRWRLKVNLPIED